MKAEKDLSKYLERCERVSANTEKIHVRCHRYAKFVSTSSEKRLFDWISS
jgi:hypothetical protein